MIKTSEEKQQGILTQWLLEDEWRLRILKEVACLELPQCCVAAGFVRNLIWDKLHGFERSTVLDDVDVIYFDPGQVEEEQDRYWENELQRNIPARWSVKNQARMHVRNHHRPYTSTEDAMMHWVEVETAIGARWVPGIEEDRIELVAPFGVSSNFNGTITFNQVAPNQEAFIERRTKKGWCKRWPQLKVIAEG